MIADRTADGVDVIEASAAAGVAPAVSPEPAGVAPASSRDPARPHWMIAWGTAALALWFVLFGLGLFINSAAYRDQVAKELDSYNLLMSLVTYTPTNVGLICLVAAFIGGCTSRLQMSHLPAKHAPKAPRGSGGAGRKSAAADGSPAAATGSSASEGAKEPLPPTESELYRSENPGASLLRGFVVYGAYMAGSAIATDDPFGSTSPEQYARSAGALSLAAFTIGFDPTFLYSLIRLKAKGSSGS